MKKIQLSRTPQSAVEPEKVRNQDYADSQSQESQMKSKKKKKLNPKSLIFIILSVLIVIVAGSYLFMKWRSTSGNSATGSGESSTEACLDLLNPECWTKAFRPELKQENGKTTALIVGIDTRASGSGSGLMNTDTLMLVTYYHDTHETRILSFPRDLYAPYGCDDRTPYKTKINAIYAYGKSHCGGDAMGTLVRTVQKISGEKVQYTALIKLEGVVEAINAMGGIDVYVTEDHTDVYPYVELSKERQKTCNVSKAKGLPGKMCLFTFKKGTMHMDGETALIYSRMRYLSNDFDRGRRQQEVIVGIKTTITNQDKPLLEKANTFLNIYNTLSKYIEVKLDLETMLGALDAAGNIKKEPIKVVLDPKFGGGGVIAATGSGGNYGFKDYSFQQVQNILKFINENADIYRDRAKIYAVNYTGEKWTADNPMMKLTKTEYKWFVTVVTQTKGKVADKYGVEVIDYTGGKMNSTIDWIKAQYGADNVTVITANEENKLAATTQYKENIAVNIYPNKPATPSPSASAEASAG